MRPPENVEPSELFLKLLEKPAPSEVFPFPRTGDDGEPLFNVRIFVLKEKQLESCKLRARKWLLEKAKDQHAAAQSLDDQTIGDRICKELIAEAVHQDERIPGTAEDKPRYIRLFRGAEDVGELTSDEIAALYGAYLLLQHSYGPTDTSFQTQEEINEWIARLEDGARPFALSLLRSHQRDALLLSLAGRVGAILQILTSPQETWLESLESIQETWHAGIDSSTPPVADSAPSLAEDIITPEEAMEAARRIQRLSGKSQ